MERARSQSGRKGLWIIAIAVVLAIIFIGYSVFANDIRGNVSVSVGAKTFQAKVANTNSELAQGLSNTDELEDSHALLMVFSEDGYWKIWMKDMNYPIDVVWLDSNKRVVDIVKNIKPESYPDTAFQPHRKARYVLELPSGSIKQYNIKPGTTAKFDIGG